MEKYIEVTCPHCRVVLVVDRVTGELLETREPILRESTGDRFKDALKKARSGPQEAEEKFNRSREAEKHKERDLDDLFRRSLEQVQNDGPVEKPTKEIDLE